MYVNTYVIPIPEKRKSDYLKLARVFVEVAKDFGAEEVFENWELEVPDGAVTDYRKAVQAKTGEKIVVSWVIWPDRETGAAAHKGMIRDPRMAGMQDIPFDGKRMILGGFEPIVHFRKSQVQ